MSQQIQQGDVVFEVVAEIPKDAAKRKSLIVREGEGHHVHEIEGDAELFERGGVLYAKVAGPARLVHRAVGGGPGEHRTLVAEEMPPGLYMERGIREHNPWTNEAARVTD